MNLRAKIETGRETHTSITSRFFGSPSEQDPWALSFEGHHLSLNFSFRKGKVVDSTPQFMAANPATVMNDVSNKGVGKGTRVLKDEEQLAFDLINSLSDEQREAATIAEKAPKEFVLPVRLK